MYDHLFQKGQIGTMETSNRIVMTAIGHALGGVDGSVTPESIAFFAERAKGGVGLIITACMVVDRETGRGDLRQLAVWDDAFIPGIRRLVQEVHRYGAKLAVQIYHPGRQGPADLNGGSMPAPSAIECQSVHQPVHAMTVEEIRAMVDRFAQAARRLKEAGVDAVEIHGAHGYLITQFLSPYANVRTDAYGGSLENRMRFLTEIIAAVQTLCGRDYPLLVRLTADEFLERKGLPGAGIVLEDAVLIAKALEKQGVHALDISSGTFETVNTAWEPCSYEQGWKAYLSQRIREEVSIPVIGVCVIRDPQVADDLIAQGKMDFAGSARQHFADPDWSAKAKAGKPEEIRKCISCLYCMETLMEADRVGLPVRCSVNICAGRELSCRELPRDGAGRTVAVVGGGPAGMEAARILALRGFSPVLFEKQPCLGGQLEYAKKPPHKKKIAWLTDYLAGQMKVLGVDVRLGKAAELEELRALNPYGVILAQGSDPIMPGSIPGIRGESVYDPTRILSGEISLSGKNIAVVGSGMTGIETADLLAEQGNRVSLFEMADDIGPGLFFQNLMDVMGRLAEYGVKPYPAHKLISLENGRARFRQTGSGEELEFAFDAVVISLGTAPKKEGAEEFLAAFPRTAVIGDAAKAGRIRHAMETAFETARSF